ncbi:ferredoxin family protein [Paenibacillus hodogayensis]|uniref:Ferredoxin family protein n=1 Tax=Paenibacillus hodogayensis TaxID=279208 RepID=A0ABV5VRC4_9BACL
MIELLSEDRCISCNQCVKVCPTNVFEATEDGVPVIARQSDCQTCFMCELYCPVDALYVTPFAEQAVAVLEKDVEERGLLGSYRSSFDWNKRKKAEKASEDKPLMKL